MPILQQVDRDEPLGQGDLLEGVILHCTDETNKPAKIKPTPMALVISRPCNIQNDQWISVARVVPRPVALPKDLQAECEDVQQLANRLARVRDADGSDSFYLGTIPGDQKQQRWFAQLNILTTIAVPLSQRNTWILRHRVARLDADFRRDLHTRLFLSIAKQGFDDHAWFCDADLELLLKFGSAKLKSADAAVAGAEAAIETAKAQNDYSCKQRGLEDKLANAKKRQSSACFQLKPFQLEQERRNALKQK